MSFNVDTRTRLVARTVLASLLALSAEAATVQTPPLTPAGTRPLEGTHWRATELAGKPAPPQDAKREAHLVFQAGGRVAGSDGCNRITGTFERKGDAVKFGQMAGTRMACVDTAEIEQAFREALNSATRLTVLGDRLGLYDVAGKRLAAFTASAQTSSPSPPPSPPPPPSPSPSPSPSSSLEGTSWQLVKFQGGDGTTLTPDDRTKYTIKFGAGWRATARVDCNRGGGSWKSSGPNQLQFGPLALTRAQCPAGSMHDQIVKQWANVRSYVIKDGHLFVSLMADGGIYEFEQAAKAKP
jgi:heat shock protein HslJ